MTTAQLSKLEDAIVLMRDLSEFQNRITEFVRTIQDAQISPSKTAAYEFDLINGRVQKTMQNIEIVTKEIENILISLLLSFGSITFSKSSIPDSHKAIIIEFEKMQYALKTNNQSVFSECRQKWNELLKKYFTS